jgi:anti-sigma B factor antagonist
METEKGLKLTLESVPGGGGGIRVMVKGQLTFPNIRQFQSDINRILVAGCKYIEIDLSDLTYLDSSGMAVFLPLNERFKQAQGSLKIVHPRRIIRHLFTSAHLDTVLDIGPEKS